jgi:hypothetical protein
MDITKEMGTVTIRGTQYVPVDSTNAQCIGCVGSDECDNSGVECHELPFCSEYYRADHKNKIFIKKIDAIESIEPKFRITSEVHLSTSVREELDMWCDEFFGTEVQYRQIKGTEL